MSVTPEHSISPGATGRDGPDGPRYDARLAFPASSVILLQPGDQNIHGNSLPLDAIPALGIGRAANSNPKDIFSSSETSFAYNATLVEGEGAPVINRILGFNLQAAIRSAGGPVVEIGGPSRGGYVSLTVNEATLPERPLVVNINSGIQGVDIVADAGDLFFAKEKSIGIALTSFLPMFDHQQTGRETYSAEKEDMINASYAEALASAADLGIMKGSRNPRIRLLAELKDKIKPRGIGIIQGGESVTSRDVKVAEKLGFTIAESGNASAQDEGSRRYHWAVLLQSAN